MVQHSYQISDSAGCGSANTAQYVLSAHWGTLRALRTSLPQVLAVSSVVPQCAQGYQCALSTHCAMSKLSHCSRATGTSGQRFGFHKTSDESPHDSSQSCP